MRMICVDDEKLVLQYTLSLCDELPQIDETVGFSDPDDALKYLKENDADIALLDIDMPKMNGIQMAIRMKKMRQDIAIIFLTGYSQYAVEAFSLHASGYLLKPIGKKRLEEEIDYAIRNRNDKTDSDSHIKVQTFGNFDVLVDGNVITFNRSKAKELLAYLVDRQGRNVTRAEAFAILWEDGQYDRPMQKQLDVIIRSLRNTLDAYDINEILEVDRGQLRVNTQYLDCDLYRFLAGDLQAINSFRGEYMNSYSWAEFTEAYITQKVQGNL